MLKLFRQLKHCKRYAVMAMIFMCLQSLINLALPTVVSKILDQGVDKGKAGYIVWMGTIMCIIAILGCFIGILGNYFSAKTSTNFGANLRRATFVKVTEMSQQEHEKFGTASLITRTTNDIQHLQDLILTILKILIPAPVLFIGGAVLSFIYNAKLALIIIIAMPLVVGVAYAVFKVTKKLFDSQQKKVDTINRIVREKLSGIRVIRAFNREPSEDEKFNESNIELTNIALKINRIFAIIIPIGYLTLYTVLALVMIFGAKEINSISDPTKLSTSVYDLQMFMIFIVLMITGIGMASAIIVMIPSGIVSAKRLNEVLDCEISVKENEHPLHFTQEDSKQTHLVFKDVKFCYPDAEESVLQNINFECKAGETTAIIGSTGAGKSTLINLIPRFFDVISGEILLDGINIKDVPRNELRSRIALIPQKAFLFSGTIADNIRYGKPDATEEEIWRALRISQSEDFVRMMPEQLEAIVSQSGKNLSGGQKQRLSIARAIASDSDILIFDDSFSALDFKTEAKLHEALNKYTANANIIIVAQRINTVINADRIIVLDEGKIVGMGKHSELIKSCEAYKEIALSQLSPEEVLSVG